MRHKKYIIWLSTLGLTLGACDSKLDIVPLGQTTLDTLDELETLLNQEFYISMGTSNPFEVVAGTSYPRWESAAEVLAVHNTLNYAFTAWDETVDRADLTTTDEFYSAIYEYVNYMNVVISKADDAEGSDSKREQLVAEAHVLRAYFHYLAVNIYAGQYDESTANSLGGIAYVDNTNVQEQKTKLTVGEVYNRLLEDTDDQYLEALIVKDDVDPCRIGKDFGYAMRAMVLMQMKRYDEALDYALKSIEINPQIEDRSGILDNKGEWELEKNSPNNLLFINAMYGYGSLYGMYLSRETAALLDPNDFSCVLPDNYNPKKYTLGWNFDDGADSFGVEGVAMNKNAWSAYFNNWGVRTEMIYYIAAECYIRQGNIANGFELMDKVLVNRIKDFTNTPTTVSVADAMQTMMDRKVIEMIGQYVNLFDRKRWNSEADYKRTYTRDLGSYGTYSIAPDSPLWIFPFPMKATNYNSSLTQNY
ncbi:MAG: RagB/SusD family nutrient uptake outer membrane protein [Bacteroidales bacterium]|nr:RagB/SusD family nutrient uptake outer membrane protein [Bacteroidales bacterium]